MAISGTVPFFDVSVSDHLGGATVVTVTGTEADSQANGTYGSEGLAAFLRRGLDALSLSGILSGTAQAITPAELSGVMHFQQELAFRVADLEKRAAPAAARLTYAQTVLAAASGVSNGTGQVQFGA